MLFVEESTTHFVDQNILLTCNLRNVPMRVPSFIYLGNLYILFNDFKPLGLDVKLPSIKAS